MANEFNIFFSQIAHKIRSTIPETSTSPDSYTTPRNPTFEFHLCSPEIINEIILSLETKTSLDIDFSFLCFTLVHNVHWKYISGLSSMNIHGIFTSNACLKYTKKSIILVFELGEHVGGGRLDDGVI